MARVVLVVDMLRGFLEEGYPLYCGARARRIVPAVGRLLEQETELGAKIFYLCDRHTPDDPEFTMFPPHCIEGSPEAEIIPELSRYPGEIIPKKTFSGFYETTLDKKLKSIKPETLVPWDANPCRTGSYHTVRRMHRHLRSPYRSRRASPGL